MSKWHSEMIAANRSYFGDFDLLCGAAKYNLKIADLPVRCVRTYGRTNIQKSTYGWLLRRMVAQAMAGIKFL